MMSIKSTLIFRAGFFVVFLVNAVYGQDTKSCTDKIARSIEQLASGMEKQSLKKEMQFLFREKISKVARHNKPIDFNQKVQEICAQPHAQDHVTALRKSLRKKKHRQSLTPMKETNFDQNRFANR